MKILFPFQSSKVIDLPLSLDKIKHPVGQDMKSNVTEECCLVHGRRKKWREKHKSSVIFNPRKLSE